jgi:hypothetical protein
MGKMTKTPFKGIVERASDLIEIIHTDVCGPMSVPALGGFLYFITFTDDLSRYGYIYLMKNKSETFEKFKEFQNEVENRHDKKIKFLRSDRGGEYLRPPGTPQRNGVSERHNRTLLDMVRSMMSISELPLSFWGLALETAAFTHNRAPTKSVETTPYELWFGKKPKLSFLKIWGCEAYVKCLQPNKLEPKAEKMHLCRLSKETIGYSFYNKTDNKVFVARTGVFLEKEFLMKGLSGRTIELDEQDEQSSAAPGKGSEKPTAPKAATHAPVAVLAAAPAPVAVPVIKSTVEPRRSGRVRFPIERYEDEVLLVDNNEPTTYNEAMMDPDSVKWQEAMKSKIEYKPELQKQEYNS